MTKEVYMLERSTYERVNAFEPAPKVHNQIWMKVSSRWNNMTLQVAAAIYHNYINLSQWTDNTSFTIQEPM